MACRLSKKERERRARASELMKKRRRDPAFILLHRAAMRRLNGDPKFKAESRARIKRLHADPAFRARQRDSVSLRAEARAAILAALKAGASGTTVARSIVGVSVRTVYRIAKHNGIKISRPRALTPAQLALARQLVDAGEKQYVIARRFGVDASTLSRYLARPTSQRPARKRV
jgi:hypothetical protein